MSFSTDLPTLTRQIQAATAAIKAARDPTTRAAAISAGQDLYGRAAGIMALRAAENETRRALATPQAYGMRK